MTSTDGGLPLEVTDDRFDRRTRYILEGYPRNVKGRLRRDVLVTDPDGHRSVTVEVANGDAMDVLEALREAYQQGREDNAPTALAQAVMQLADLGGMPDSFWCTDNRVKMARDVLGVPEDGRISHAHLWEAAS